MTPVVPPPDPPHPWDIRSPGPAGPDEVAPTRPDPEPTALGLPDDDPGPFGPAVD